MRKHPSIAKAATKQIAQRFITDRVPAFDDYCGLDSVRGPVLEWDAGEMPDLALPGLHLVPGDLIARNRKLEDRELNQWILVAGDLECDQLWTASWFFVAGTLEAKLVVGQSGCNNMLHAQRARVGAILERGHSVVVTEDLDCPIIYSEHGLVAAHEEEEQFPETDAADIFLPDLITADGEVDWKRWQKRVDAKKPWSK